MGENQEFGVTRRARRHKKHKHGVSIGRTAVGKGIFALRNIWENAIVGEIQGVLIEDSDYGSDYCFQLGDQYRLEPTAPFRYVNHSCDPNCEFDWLEVAEHGDSSVRKRAFLIALRDIRRGEQLTIDYKWSATAAIPCRCRSPKCRGWIVDERQLGELMDKNSAANPMDG